MLNSRRSPRSGLNDVVRTAAQKQLTYDCESSVSTSSHPLPMHASTANRPAYAWKSATGSSCELGDLATEESLTLVVAICGKSLRWCT